MSKTLALRLAAIPAFVAATAGSAMAAVPADVTTSLTTLKEDGVSMATIVLVAIIAVFAIKFLRKGV